MTGDDGYQIDEFGRPHAPAQGDEVRILRGFLAHHRATLAWKCEGLDAAGLSARIPTSSLTLGGLLKHMALVEESWFGRALFDAPAPAPWDTVDWDATPDWDFDSAADDTPEELWAMWRAAVALADERITTALAEGGLDRLSAPNDDGHRASLRWILVHMIEEYARHNGHADLLREAVDGTSGE